MLDALWYEGRRIGLLLVPLGWMFGLVSALRRWAYRHRIFTVHRFSIPVIVVGNISVGGTGKTPLVIWLAKVLRGKGYRPGIVCRGYRGEASAWPQQVQADSDPLMVGDEAVMLAQRARCAVAAGPARAEAVALLMSVDCNVIISDDGLQHYGLGRDIEVCVVDGARRHGNGRLLPAGPLRELKRRLDCVDFVVVNGQAKGQEIPMQVYGDILVSLSEGPQHHEKRQPISAFAGQAIHAVAGTGNAERFFQLLRSASLEVIPHRFPDHHVFRRHEIVFDDGRPVLMTEKDAVKCRPFADASHWYLPVSATLPASFEQNLMAKLEKVKCG